MKVPESKSELANRGFGLVSGRFWQGLRNGVTKFRDSGSGGVWQRAGGRGR